MPWCSQGLNCDLWGRGRQELYNPWHFHLDISFFLASDLVNIETTDRREQGRARNVSGGSRAPVQHCMWGERPLSKVQPPAAAKQTRPGVL